jgi:predicted metal-dependent enzyme (double-stranded beta helix superfamily)
MKREKQPMNTKQQRYSAIESMVVTVKAHLSDGVNVESLNLAKGELLKLCKRKDLFPRSDFPVPDEKQIEWFYLIYEDEQGGYALYINSALPCQTYRPHNHGGSWAIIAALEGEEKHGLYRALDDDSVELLNEIVVKPGTAVSMLEDGIHSIAAQGDKPLLHLHFYATSFPQQGKRTEYDLDKGIAEHMFLEDLDYIVDLR